MSQSVLGLLQFDAATAKRAQWEGFEFTVIGNGDVLVSNGSYPDSENHAYTVHIEGGIPTDCTCPRWQYGVGACKHMVAVAIRRPVLEAVQRREIAPDGGEVREREEATYTYHVEPLEQGGEEYVRCEKCGAEVLTALGGKDKLEHVKGCPEGAR